MQRDGENLYTLAKNHFPRNENRLCPLSFTLSLSLKRIEMERERENAVSCSEEKGQERESAAAADEREKILNERRIPSVPLGSFLNP